MRALIILILFSAPALLRAADWPVYKGNLYFTANNDEIIVKNNNLKWLFKAKSRVANPVVSDGRIYFTDLKKNLYCIDEESGSVLWMHNLLNMSEQFSSHSRVPGKIKYPLIKDRYLIITQGKVIYVFNKITGRIIWARTGLRRGTETQHTARVDGIYADPTVHEDSIFFGTRKSFMSRSIRNGRLKWHNDNINSWSGFPAYYDKFIFTQSMNYSTGSYRIYCLDRKTGRAIWSRELPKPMKIFSPVIYRDRVYIAINRSLKAFKLKDGSPVFSREYKELISSHPSFSDREIIFTLGNRKLVAADPENGNLKPIAQTDAPSSIKFALIRDIVYAASTYYKVINNRKVPYTELNAIVRGEKQGLLFNFKPPFAGGPGQLAAENGNLYLPAGEFLYAIGTHYQTEIKEDDNGYYIEKENEKGDIVREELPLITADERPSDNSNWINDLQNPDGWPDEHGDAGKTDTGKNDITTENDTGKDEEKLKLRDHEITVTDEKGNPVRATVEITHRNRDGRVIWQKNFTIGPSETVRIPDKDNVDILVHRDRFAPARSGVDRKNRKSSFKLQRLVPGSSFTIENINFEKNKSYLTRESKPVLNKLVDILQKYRAMQLQIIGHTDSSGSKAYNQTLSEKRAESVRDFLIKSGISPERLTTAGRGESRPLAENTSAEGRAANRRTEFKIIRN